MSIKSEYSNIYEILNEYKSNRKNDDIKRLFFNNAVEFASKVEGCFICNHPDIAQELIFCYSVKNSKEIDKLLKSFENQLFNCTSCIDTFHQVSRNYIENAKTIYGVETAAYLEEHLRKDNIKRIERCIKTVIRTLNNHSSLSNSEIEAYQYCGNNMLYEILRYPDFLKVYSLNSHFIKLFHCLMSKKKIELITKFHPGVFVIAFHQNAELREWITSLIGIAFRNLSYEDYVELKPYILNLFEFKKFVDENPNLIKSKNYKLFKSKKDYECNPYFCFIEDTKIIYKNMLSLIPLMDKAFVLALSEDIPYFFNYICTETFERPDNNPIFALNAIFIITKFIRNHVWNFENFEANLILEYYEKLMSYKKYQDLMKNRPIDLEKEAFLLTWIVYYIQSAEGILSTNEITILWKKLFFYYRDWTSGSKVVIDGFMLSYLNQLQELEQRDDFASMILKNLYSSESLSYFYNQAIRGFFIEDIKSINLVHKYTTTNKSELPIIINDKDEKLNPVKKEIDTMDVDSQSINTNVNMKPEIKIHSAIWINFFKRFDLILNLPGVLVEIVEIVSNLFFIYSENHNSEEESQANFIIHLYMNFIKKLLGQTILKTVFYNEHKIHLLVKQILSPHMHLSEISYKLLENITNKKNKNDALNVLFNVFPTQCSTYIKNIIYHSLSVKTSNDVYCLFYRVSSIANFIHTIVIDIETKYKIPEYLKTEDLLICIFNFLHIGFKKINNWYNKIDNDILMNCYSQMLNTFTIILNSIDNKGKKSHFHQIAPELDRYIIPLFE